MHHIEPNQDYRDDTLRKNTELSTDELKSDAAKHYDDCYHDYLFAWCNRENLALHYAIGMKTPRHIIRPYSIKISCSMI